MKTENVFGLPAAAATKKCELSNGSLTTPELCAFLCSSSCTLFVSSCYSKLWKFVLKPVAFITLQFLILIFSSTFPYCLSFRSKPQLCAPVLELVSFCIEHILLLVDPFSGVEIYLYLLLLHCTALLMTMINPPHLTLLQDVQQMGITLMLRQMRPLYNLFYGHFWTSFFMDWFYMSLEVIFSRCFVFTICAWKLLTIMNWFYVCLEVSFLSCFVFTLWTIELLTFMDWLYVCLKTTFLSCFEFTLWTLKLLTFMHWF